MSDEPNKTVKDSGPAPISSTSPGAGEGLLRAGIMQQPDQPGMLGKIGRFDVIKLIGQGGMGQVLLAREPVTNVKVAIKVLKPQFARDAASVHRFLTEARHAYAMGHPHILKVMEVSDSDDRPFYVVPYIEGGSLAARIGPQKLLPTETVLDIARQIAGALSYAHGRGIIHRDLKPANVLVDGEGRAYLTDFGLLRTVFNDSFLDVQQSSLEGTAPYMSPAMVQGKAEDTRCDIYSFGAMLYEMLVGQPPYTGPSIEIILRKIAAGPPEPLLKINPKASKELAAIAEWAMARELRDRYATMADVLSDLERVAKGKEPVGPRGIVGLGRPTRRNLAIAGAALAVVAMVAFAVWKTATHRSSKAGSASNPEQKIDLTSGLVAHFPLDGHVRDVTGNGHDGQIHGNVRYVNSPNGQAIDLDGSSWVTLPDTNFLDGSSNATIALWFLSRATNGGRTVLASGDGRDAADPTTAQFDCSSGWLRACGFEDTVAPNRIYAAGGLRRELFQDSRWHYFAMTLESEPKATTLRVYLDGELKEARTITGAVPIRYDRPMPTSIGATGDGSWNWIGSLDDVRIYSRTLSPAEVQKLFSASGTAQNLLVNASPTLPPAAPASATQILPVPNRTPRVMPPGATTPVPTPVAPPGAVLPTRRPAESPEARLAKMQAMFNGKVTLRPDGRFEFYYDFSDPAQLDDWISREATAEWAVEAGSLVCKKTGFTGGSDTRLHLKALFAGKDREISYDAQGPHALGTGLYAQIDSWAQGYYFHLPDYENSAWVDAGSGARTTTNFAALDPKHTYHVDAKVKNDAFSFAVDGKEILKGPIPPANVQTGRMAFLKVAHLPGRFDNVRVIGALDPLEYQYLFYDHFEAGLGQWTGRDGGRHSGVIVPDPISSGRGNVLTFTNLCAGGGDIYSRRPFPTAGYVEITFDYLGLAKPGSVAGDLGGFFGTSSSLAHKMPSPADNFFVGTAKGWSPPWISLLDNGEWHRITHRFRADGMPPLHLVMQDWADSGGVAGDFYFDNITVKLMAGPISVPVLAGPVTNPANGHLYYLLVEDTWQNSEVQAVELGGHLVTINDKAEQDWVFSTFGSHGGTKRSLWIGLREVDVEGNYQWVSGEPVGFTHWMAGEPLQWIETQTTSTS